MTVIKGKIPKFEAPKYTLPTHRYYCDACTGIAFFWNENNEMPLNGTPCKSCGKPVVVVKRENFIKTIK